MNRFEIEVHCPECGGTDLWPEGQHLKKCSYCATPLYFEPKPATRFFLKPSVESEQQVREVIVLFKAEQQRAEDSARYPGDDDKHPPEMLVMPKKPLAPYLAEFERRVGIQECKLIYVPYWHFQATLLQCLLSRSDHDVREYQLRSMEIDEALAGYNDTRWNFRDNGLRFGQAKLTEATAQMLSAHPHLPFSGDVESRLDRMMNAFPPLAPHYDFKLYRLCGRQRLPIFRPYWIVRFACDGVETALVDACFGSVAGHPDGPETATFLSYNETPYVSSEPPQVRVLPSRCPECGSDTDWGVDDIIRFCRNCGRALALKNSELQCVPYDYSPLPDDSWCHLPFWKLSVRVTWKTITYTNLKDYFRESFPVRVLRDGPYGDSLWIPAVQPKRIEKGDEFFSALIADATSRSLSLQEGPSGTAGSVRAANVDAVTASEMAACALPSASGAPPALHKLVTMSRMLRETSVEVKDARLVLVPYRAQQQDLLVGKQRFSTKLL